MPLQAQDTVKVLVRPGTVVILEVMRDSAVVPPPDTVPPVPPDTTTPPPVVDLPERPSTGMAPREWDYTATTAIVRTTLLDAVPGADTVVWELLEQGSVPVEERRAVATVLEQLWQLPRRDTAWVARLRWYGVNEAGEGGKRNDVVGTVPALDTVPPVPPDTVPPVPPDTTPPPPLVPTPSWQLAAATDTPMLVADSPLTGLAAGTVYMQWEAADAGPVQGLAGSDHRGYGTGGHLSILLRRDSLLARIQDTTTSYPLQVPVAPGRREAAYVWGPGGAQLWLDGQLVASNDYQGGTQGNVRPLLLAALQWDSAPDSMRIASPLQGTLQQVRVWPQRLSADQLAEVFSDTVVVVPPPVEPPDTLPPPPPGSGTLAVGSVRQVRHAYDDSVSVWWHVDPILAAAQLRLYVDGQLAVAEAKVWPVVFPGVVTQSGPDGWVAYLPPQGTDPNDVPPFNPHTSMVGWTRCVVSRTVDANQACGYSRQQQLAWVRRRPCDAPWYDGGSARVCNHSLNAWHSISVHLAPGVPYDLRLDAVDAQGAVLATWQVEGWVS